MKAGDLPLARLDSRRPLRLAAPAPSAGLGGWSVGTPFFYCIVMLRLWLSFFLRADIWRTGGAPIKRFENREFLSGNRAIS
ncbi:MAG: hypothetical protein U1F83_06600 [Verrucomicrobiota bacterium]